MRLLHVMAEMDPEKGGVGQAVRTMMAGLADLGISNEAVTLDSPDATFLTTLPLTIHAIGPARGPWSFSPGLMPWLLDNLMSYDAVLIHGLWLYHGYAVRKALRTLKTQKGKKGKALKKLPALVVMPHGMLDPYFQKAAGRKLKAIRNWLYWKIIESKIVNNANALFFTSIEERNLARLTFKPYRPLKEIVVGLGIQEPPEYTSIMRDAFNSALPDLNNSSYILFLGRIDEKKGVDLLVHAYIERITNQPVKQDSVFPKLVIAGPGIETLYGQRIKKSASLFANQILFPGMLVADCKWGAFYGCDAFILPSHQENFGIAVVEALACNKPVLISNQVNIWQEIKSETAGLVDEDTFEGTLRLLQSWSAMTEIDQHKMGKQAVNCFKKHFAIHTAADKIKNALSSL